MSDFHSDNFCSATFLCQELSMSPIFRYEVIHESLPRHELENNCGFADFKLLLVIQNARDMAKIWVALVTGVCSTPSGNM